MDKLSIDAVLAAKFHHLHWRRMRLCYFPPCFARDTEVSPLFLARPLRRQGYYQIDGYLGVICQPFERASLAEHGVPKDNGRNWNPIWFALNIANVAALRELQNVNTESEVAQFCEQTAAILERMPNCMAGLRNTLKQDKMLGHAISHWTSARPEKLDAFIKYLAVS